MSRALERRLIVAERRLNPPVPAGGEFVIIREIITPGGLPGSDDDPTFATAGEMRWERAPAETLAAFRARAVAAATAAGERRIVIGGLSDNDPLDDAPPESCNGDRPRAAAAVAEAAQDGREHDARSVGAEQWLRACTAHSLPRARSCHCCAFTDSSLLRHR